MGGKKKLDVNKILDCKGVSLSEIKRAQSKTFSLNLGKVYLQIECCSN